MRETFTCRVISSAGHGRGHTTPNPLVGVTPTRGGKIIGEGFHAFYGGLYAEHVALEDCFQCGLSPAGVSFYVTLEPCYHIGKQPSCTGVILVAGIRAVFAGSSNSNPLIASKGAAALRQGGTTVTEHASESTCDALSVPLFHHIRTGLPFILPKYVMTLDDKTVYVSGTSRWVIGGAVRREVYRIRVAVGTVMVDINTVLRGSPLLTCRIPGRQNPFRVVRDPGLRTPLDSAFVKAAAEVPTLLACYANDTTRHEACPTAGCKIFTFLGRYADLRALLTSLGARGINGMLIEGGVELGWVSLSVGLVQHIQAYIAPKLFGEKNTPPTLGGTGVPYPIDAFVLRNMHIRSLGAGVRIEGDL